MCVCVYITIIKVQRTCYNVVRGKTLSFVFGRLPRSLASPACHALEVIHGSASGIPERDCLADPVVPESFDGTRTYTGVYGLR